MERMSSPTVCLILGAGASKPYGYPLGWQLKERIIQYCLSKPPDCAPPEKRAETWDKLEQFGRRFDQDQSATIDAFLSTLRREDELGRHGRMAIVAVLRTYEHCYEERKEWYEKNFEFLESKPWPRWMERRLGAHSADWRGDPERPACPSVQRMDSEIGLHHSSWIRFRLHELEPYWIG